MDKTLVRKVVLTGGPCGGKTTAQLMLSDLFENMGWKVYRVSETATILLGGGVMFAHLTEEQSSQFQLNLLKVMVLLEDTYMDLAMADAKKGQNVIVICDRGTMDPSAYLPHSDWLSILSKAGLNETALRDERYDCVIHLMTAAKGAEPFFTTANNKVRSEGIDLARQIDDRIAQAWIGHPCVDIIDNSTGFEEKKNRVIAALLNRLGLNDNRWGKDIVKRKYLIKNFVLWDEFPVLYRDFDVEHNYLISLDSSQIRIRKRSHIDGNNLYTLTSRTSGLDGQRIETRRSIPLQEYTILLSQCDPSHESIIKKRRCFLYENQYFQLDIFQSPNKGLVLLEAYISDVHFGSSNLEASAKKCLPPFLVIEKEVTEDPNYSMFNLSKIIF